MNETELMRWKQEAETREFLAEIEKRVRHAEEEVWEYPLAPEGLAYLRGYRAMAQWVLNWKPENLRQELIPATSDMGVEFD